MNFAIAIDFILLAAIWGASFLLMKMGATEFGPFVTAFLRVFFASLFLLPLLAWRGQLPDLRAKLKPILAVGVLNSGLPFALFAFAVLHISTGLTSILNATVPLWGAVVAWLWLGDRLTASRTLGLVIGFVGVALLAWDKASFKAGAALPGWAVLACLAATLLYGIAASFAKKYLAGIPPLASATGSQIGAAIVLLVPAALTIPATTARCTRVGSCWITGIFLHCRSLRAVLSHHRTRGPRSCSDGDFPYPRLWRVLWQPVFKRDHHPAHVAVRSGGRAGHRAECRGVEVRQALTHWPVG